jgi:hypothetical protein
MFQAFVHDAPMVYALNLGAFAEVVNGNFSENATDAYVDNASVITVVLNVDASDSNTFLKQSREFIQHLKAEIKTLNKKKLFCINLLLFQNLSWSTNNTNNKEKVVNTLKQAS